jgi:hypothetical protein
MTDAPEQCDTLAFYDTVDNLIDGIQKFDFSDELSTDMCDVYQLAQGQSLILANIDYEAESIAIIRRTGESDEVLRSFGGEDFTPELASNIVRITYEALG